LHPFPPFSQKKKKRRDGFVGGGEEIRKLHAHCNLKTKLKGNILYVPKFSLKFGE